jgi:hypothetical protein
VTAGGQLAWGPGPVGRLALMDPFEAARDTWAGYTDDPRAPYVDYHVWHFTPAGFALVLLELGQLGLVNWRIDRLEGPENFEFFAFLRRGTRQFADAGAMQAERLVLLRRQLLETGEQTSAAPRMYAAAELPGSDDASGARDQMSEILALLHLQDQRLRELQTTAAWVRAALRPVRAVWRAVRRRPPDPGREG